MLFNRKISQKLLADVTNSGKVTLLYGPRQVGKTTLSKQIIKKLDLKSLMINADQSKYIDVLSSRDLNRLKSLIAGYDLLFIDEGQRVPEIGINLKILHDEIPDLKILVTGSSSFLLSDRVTESLTGRKKVHTLLPLALQEFSQYYNSFEINERLEERLIYGNYPEAVTLSGFQEKEEYLVELSSSFIYKDILELESIKYPLKIRDLLRLLAYQVGSQVSLHEISKQLGINRETVERYLYLLEQSFVIFRLTGFSRNLRKEVVKSDKFYFFDNGIRNIIIDNLNPLKNRNDIGALWENYIISERKKFLIYNNIRANSYYWRTYTGSEIDYVEERQGNLFAYEIKYGKAKAKLPKTWAAEYGTEFELINKEDYLSFLSP